MIQTRAHVVAALVLAAVALAAFPASSSAKIQVGIGDQNEQMFSDPLFKDLKVKKARIVAPWNMAFSQKDIFFFEQWLRSARSAGVTPLVHFGASNGTRCPKRPCKAPSVSQYRKAFKAFRKRYPTIHDIGVWNEANQR